MNPFPAPTTKPRSSGDDLGSSLGASREAARKTEDAGNPSPIAEVHPTTEGRFAVVLIEAGRRVIVAEFYDELPAQTAAAAFNRGPVRVTAPRGRWTPQEAAA